MLLRRRDPKHIAGVMCGTSKVGSADAGECPWGVHLLSTINASAGIPASFEDVGESEVQGGTNEGNRWTAAKVRQSAVVATLRPPRFTRVHCIVRSQPTAQAPPRLCRSNRSDACSSEAQAHGGWRFTVSRCATRIHTLAHCVACCRAHTPIFMKRLATKRRIGSDHDLPPPRDAMGDDVYIGTGFHRTGSVAGARAAQCKQHDSCWRRWLTKRQRSTILYCARVPQSA